MAGRLARTVYVRSQGTTPTRFGPNDEVPAWAAALITNPAAWVPGTGQVAPPLGDETPKPPPLKGRGSSRDAWAAYAEACGVAVEDSMSRDDIAAAVEAAGARTA